MISAATQLRNLVNSAKLRLLSLPETRVSEKPYTEKWSLKEVLGHLIDSAVNNHQRIVRMQQQADLGSFSYKQEQWNAIQKYQLERWTDLVELWVLFNNHLAHVIEHVDPRSLDNTCDMGYVAPAKLRFVIEDYLRHVQHHLDQILSDGDPRQRKQWARRNPEQE